MPDSEIAQRFKTDRGYIGQLRRSIGLKVSDREKARRKKVAIIASYKSKKHPEDTKIKRLYLSVPIKRLAQEVERSQTFVKTRLKALGLRIPRHIVEQRKRDSQIKPGHIPANKGRKASEYMSHSALCRSAKTRFKKGHKPANTLSNGVITIRHNHKDRNAHPYAWIRIRKAKWKMVHVWMWEKKYGRIPKNKIVVFKDGNTMNLQLSNLELITREENMRRNSIHNLPPQLKETAYLIGRITRQINRYEKQN